MKKLYIGKNHSGERSPIQSIFRLVGNDEDALTYALGFLMAYDYEFCQKVVSLTGVGPRSSPKSGYSIHLQEVTGRGSGRRDIVIESDQVRIVLEAKIGDAIPTTKQLLKYAKEKRLWKQFKTRGIVALTQVELPETTRDEVSKVLSKRDISLSTVQWHEVIHLALKHKPSDNSEVGRFLFHEFIGFIRGNYRMNYYDAEVLVKNVNPANAEVFTEGWMYVTNLKDKSAPLYFAPYFTGQGDNSGISMFSRVLGTEIVKLAEVAEVGGAIQHSDAEHCEKWSVGLEKLRIIAKDRGFDHQDQRLFLLDRPIVFRATPLTKKYFKSTNPRKEIPGMIPVGFSLRFDDLLMHSEIGSSSATA